MFLSRTCLVLTALVLPTFVVGASSPANQDEAWVSSLTANDVPIGGPAPSPSPVAARSIAKSRPAGREDVDRRDSAPRWFGVLRAATSAQLYRSVWSGSSAKRSLSGARLNRATHPIGREAIARGGSFAVVRSSSTSTTLNCRGGARSNNPDQDIYLTVDLYVDGQVVGSGSGWGYNPNAMATGTLEDVGYDRNVECLVLAGGAQAYASGTLQGTALPTGESISGIGWRGFYGNYGAFKGSLTGGTFNGRRVREQDGGSGLDTCWYPGSSIVLWTAVTGGDWGVSNNEYGEDHIGWGTNAISHYRDAGRTGGDGCRAEFDQDMHINLGSQWSTTPYKTNRIKAGIGSTWIWSERDGVVQSRSW